MAYGIIYLASNTKNGKLYVEQTTQTLRERALGHKNRALIGSKTHFHAAIRKHGFESFTFEGIDEGIDKEDLNNKEIHWAVTLHTYDPCFGYNSKPCGGNTLLTDKIKNKISQAHKGKKLSEEHKQKIKQTSTDRIHSEKSKKLMSEKQLGKRRNEETKRILSEAHKG
jgi:group I intron endonuclease